MKNKKIIERNLSLSVKYQLISISRSDIENASGIPCDNCNAQLVNTAQIIDENGHKFTVGLDCMDTLTKNLVNLSDYEFEKYSFDAALRFYNLMGKADKVEIIEGIIYAYWKNKDGKPCHKSEFEGALLRYKFDLSKFQPKGE